MNLKHGLTGLAAFSALLLGTAALAPTVSFAQNEANWRSQWKLEPIEIAIDLYEEKLNADAESIEMAPSISDAELNELQFFIDSKTEKDAEPVEIKVPVKAEENKVEVAKAEKKTEAAADFKTDKKVDQTTFKPATKKESAKSSDRYQLGISLARLSKSTREKYKIPSDVGYGIRYIQDNSAADKAGLKKSDIVVGLGKKSIKSYSDFVKAVQDAGSDKKELKLSILRDGKKVKVSVQPTLAMRRSRSSASSSKKPSSEKRPISSRKSHSRSDMRERMKKMFESLSKDDQSKVKTIMEEMKDIRTKAMKNKGQLSDKDKSRARELMGSLMKMRSKIGGGSSKESSSRRADFIKKMRERVAAAHSHAKGKKPECKGKDCKGCDSCKKSECKNKDCKGCDKCKRSHSHGHHDHKGHHGHAHGKKPECKGKDCKGCDGCKKSECKGKDCKGCDKCKRSRSHGHRDHRGHHGPKPPHHGDKKDDHHGHRGHHGPPPHARHGYKKGGHRGGLGHHGPPPHHAHRGPHHGPKGDSHKGHGRRDGKKGDCKKDDCKKGDSKKGRHSSRRGSHHGRHHGKRGGRRMHPQMGMMHLVKRLVDKIEDLTETIEDLSEQVEELTEQLEEVEEKLDD